MYDVFFEVIVARNNRAFELITQYRAGFLGEGERTPPLTYFMG